MVRATEPQKDKKRQAPPPNIVSDNLANGTKYVLVPEEKFRERLKYALEKYDEIWKSLSDK